MMKNLAIGLTAIFIAGFGLAEIATKNSYAQQNTLQYSPAGTVYGNPNGADGIPFFTNSPTMTKMGIGTSAIPNNVSAYVNGNLSITGALTVPLGTTGSSSSPLGINCPALNCLLPFTWLKIQTSDGSLVYVGAFK